MELRGYLTEIVRHPVDAIGDLLGVWLTGSAAQDVHEHGVSDVDVLAVSGHPHPEEVRRRLGAAVSHPALPCPTVGLELVRPGRPRAPG